MLYHQNRRAESLALMQQVEQELRNLKVDEQSVFALQELGKFILKINKVYIPILEVM